MQHVASAMCYPLDLRSMSLTLSDIHSVVASIMISFNIPPLFVCSFSLGRFHGEWRVSNTISRTVTCTEALARCGEITLDAVHVYSPESLVRTELTSRRERRLLWRIMTRLQMTETTTCFLVIAVNSRN